MDEALLKRYFKRQCSPQEVQQIRDWFADETLNPEQEQVLWQFWRDVENEKPSTGFLLHTDRILAGIDAKIDQEKQSHAPSFPADQQPARQRRVLQAAAVLLPLAFLWLCLQYAGHQDKAAARLVTVAAPEGIRKTISLEDGSKIFLNSGSKVVFPAHFSSTIREIALTGEAFFEVSKDPLRPFIVRTGPLFTRVTGTTFNIKHRQQENEISVSLASGTVTIARKGGKPGSPMALLQPGQQLVYDQASHGYQVEPYNPLEVLGWRQGILVFKKAGFNQVVAQLATWYGVEIEVSGTLPAGAKQWQYTGAYHNQHLDQVLEGMAFVKKFNYEKKGKKVIIRFQ